jgi:hypothetical protein
MKDIHQLLYNMLQKNGRPTAERIINKHIDETSFEITLDYSDRSINDYIVLVQDNTIIIRYEADDNLYQDALQTSHDVKENTLQHSLENNTLTLTINHRGGNHGKRTRSH